MNMHRLFQSTTRNVRLRIVLVFRRTNRNTRQASKTAAVKATGCELLLVSRPSFGSRLAVPLKDACREPKAA